MPEIKNWVEFLASDLSEDPDLSRQIPPRYEFKPTLHALQRLITRLTCGNVTSRSQTALRDVTPVTPEKEIHMTDENDLTPLLEGAAQMHEMYSSYVEAGFTVEQAMQMICAMITAMITKGGSD